ncbi:hypothetical protein BYT27DRAFT_7176667 [Phlegmacium glaucopus]|nr:hypothetical protein BYT27DRAFT_7176667 [Phlegmacium glaucopus]
MYQQSTCDTSVKKAVENISALENLSQDSHVNHALLAEEAVQIALNQLRSWKEANTQLKSSHLSM